MINKDRIIPVQKIDLLSLIGTFMNIASVSYNVLKASDVEGTFAVSGSGSAGTFLANQPVMTLDFPAAVTGATVYFVPAYSFTGLTVAGAAATIADGSTAIEPDGASLYKAVLSGGEVTVTAVTPAAD